MKPLTPKALEQLIIKIEKHDGDIFGEYDFKGVRIIIKKPITALNRERSKRLYESRRARGLCVHCGIKVKEKNPQTNYTYRYCSFHRELELDRKKKKWQKQKLKTKRQRKK